MASVPTSLCTVSPPASSLLTIENIETDGAEFRPTYIVVPNAPCLHLQSYCGIEAIVLFVALSSRRRWGWTVVTSVILDAKRG